MNYGVEGGIVGPAFIRPQATGGRLYGRVEYATTDNKKLPAGAGSDDVTYCHASYWRFMSRLIRFRYSVNNSHSPSQINDYAVIHPVPVHQSLFTGYSVRRIY